MKKFLVSFTFLSLNFCYSQDPSIFEILEGDSLSPEIADLLVYQGIDNKTFIKEELVLITDEANRSIYDAFHDLKKAGYLQMTLIDTSNYCEKYYTYTTLKAQSYTSGVTLPDGSDARLVYTYLCDSVEVLDISYFDSYYEVRYRVVNVQQTPFYPLQPDPKVVNGATFEGSCFMRKVDGIWQVDDNAEFSGSK